MGCHSGGCRARLRGVPQKKVRRKPAGRGAESAIARAKQKTSPKLGRFFCCFILPRSGGLFFSRSGNFFPAPCYFTSRQISTPGPCTPSTHGLLLSGNIDHMRIALVIKVSELSHRSPRSSYSYNNSKFTGAMPSVSGKVCGRLSLGTRHQSGSVSSGCPP